MVAKLWNTSKSHNVSLSSDGISFVVMISGNSKEYKASAWLINEELIIRPKV